MSKLLLTLIFIGLILFFPVSFIYAQVFAPQVTFGDLLNNTQGPRSAGQKSSQQSKAELVQKFLKIIEENGNSSKLNFYGPSPTPSSTNSLSDDISQYFTTPVPTLNPHLQDILAKADKMNVEPLPNPPNPIGGDSLTPSKSSYTLAVLGDSMVDTLGESLPDLLQLLKQSYPKTNFVLLNYGQGSTTIENGLFRLTNPTKYQGRDYPPLLHLSPDIIVVESFAYNHWGVTTNDLNKQWLTAVNILDTIKKYLPDSKIVLFATISPNPYFYGDGKLNWSKNTKWDSAITTKAYLQNFISFAQSAHLPLADAYNPSLNADGHGDRKYIDSSDNIHPSAEGKLLISKKIFETIKQNNLIE